MTKIDTAPDLPKTPVFDNPISQDLIDYLADLAKKQGHEIALLKAKSVQDQERIDQRDHEILDALELKCSAQAEVQILRVLLEGTNKALMEHQQEIGQLQSGLSEVKTMESVEAHEADRLRSVVAKLEDDLEAHQLTRELRRIENERLIEKVVNVQAKVLRLRELCWEAANQRDLDCPIPKCAGGYTPDLEQRLRAAAKGDL